MKPRKPNFVHLIRAFIWAILATSLLGTASTALPDILRSWWIPTVLPTNFAGNIRYEAEISASPASVIFKYESADRSRDQLRPHAGRQHEQGFLPFETDLLTVRELPRVQTFESPPHLTLPRFGGG